MVSVEPILREPVLRELIYPGTLQSESNEVLANNLKVEERVQSSLELFQDAFTAMNHSSAA